MLEFSKGTNILIGQMGAGKSSVMDAISFALFGKYPALQHRHLTMQDIITNRPVQMQEAQVRLEFNIGTDTYEVTRAISIDGVAKATLEKNGTYVQSQPQRVNEEIERILKIDYDLFVRAIYAEQNRLTYFLELSPSERKKEIDELLGLDLFANAQDSATTLVNRINDMVKDETNAAKGFDLEKLKQALQEEKDELAKLEKEEEATRHELEEVSNEAKKQENELRTAKELLSNKQKLSKEIGELNSRKEMLENEIIKVKEQISISRQELEEKIEKATNELNTLKNKEQRIKAEEQEQLRQHAQAEAEIKTLEKNVEELEALSKEIKGKSSRQEAEKVEKEKAMLAELQQKQAQLEAGIKDNEQWLAALEKHVAKCPVCERDLDDALTEKLITSKKAAISTAKEELEKIKEEIEKYNTEIKLGNDIVNELVLKEKRQEELKGVDEKIKLLREAAEQAEKAKQLASEELAQIQKELQEKIEENTKLNGLKEALDRKERYEKQLDEIKRQVEEKQIALNEIKIDESKVEGLQSAYTQTSAKISKLTANLDSISNMKKEKQKQAKEKEDEISRVEKLYQDIEIKKKAATELTKYKNALAETQTALRSRLVNYINRTMQAIWPELYPYGDYQSIMLEPTQDDYVLKLRTNRKEKEWEEVEAIASGGERSIACLAMRVAFALVLVPNLKWLILDEPTHNIDQEGIAKFVRALGDVLPKYIEQVFIITHDEALKQVPSARIYVLERDKAANGETRVESM